MKQFLFFILVFAISQFLYAQKLQKEWIREYNPSNKKTKN